MPKIQLISHTFSDIFLTDTETNRHRCTPQHLILGGGGVGIIFTTALTFALICIYSTIYLIAYIRVHVKLHSNASNIKKRLFANSAVQMCIFNSTNLWKKILTLSDGNLPENTPSWASFACSHAFGAIINHAGEFTVCAKI